MWGRELAKLPDYMREAAPQKPNEAFVKKAYHEAKHKVLQAAGDPQRVALVRLHEQWKAEVDSMDIHMQELMPSTPTKKYKDKRR